MTQQSHEPLDVLVVGAGPTGLTAALEARRFGMSVRIIDKRARRARRSKALVVHARTMEILDGLGLATQMLAQGVRFAALNLRGVAGARGRIDLLGLDWGDTDYPFWLTVPQFDTERVLEEALADEGVQVEWGTELTALDQDDLQAVGTLSGEPGATVTSRWVIGADGSHSAVRDAIGGHLERADAGATFILADVFTTHPLPQDEGHLFLHPDGLLIIVPMPTPDLWRVIAHRPGEAPDSAESIDAAFLDDLIRRRAALEFGAHDVGWTSRFGLSHGVADVARRGRVFLAGDAIHVHSPVGGQGLNTGIQDAHNLVWKLAAADRLTEPDAEWLLETYAGERLQIATEMVAGVERATRLLTRRHQHARQLLGAIAPRILPRLPIRRVLGPKVAGLELQYAGRARDGAGGSRVPNHPTSDGARVHARLSPGGFTWVINGCAVTGPWHGLSVVRVERGPAVTLVRPDGYITASGTTVEQVISRIHPATWSSAQALAQREEIRDRH